MNLSVGIIGLPNVGKSTLFNALLKKQQAFVANYPFATIEPNIGVVPVPDPRLEKLAEIVEEQEKPQPDPLLKGEEISISPSPSRERVGVRGIIPIIPATVKFVDIAGLVKGANEGAGLGNKFLSHIREVSIIAHVVRAFDPSASSGQEEVIRVGTNPKEDYETIQTELILADLQTLEKSKVPFDSGTHRLVHPSAQGRQVKIQNLVIEKLVENLNKGLPARRIHFSEEDKLFVDQSFLLSAKPEIIVLNVSESDYSENKFDEIHSRYTSISSVEKMVVVCAKIESDLSELGEAEQKEYLNSLGIKESGLERLIKKAYETLGLISFFTTTGEKEVRAWTLRLGSTSLRASGTIHTDFIKKFIKAEVVSFEDFVSLGGWKGAREKGKARMEGRDYVVKDGDVIEFKIGS